MITIETKRAAQLDSAAKQQICEIAAQGFEQPNDAAMQADTIRHIHDADAVQLAHTSEGMVAFSLYGRSLWRPRS